MIWKWLHLHSLQELVISAAFGEGSISYDIGTSNFSKLSASSSLAAQDCPQKVLYPICDRIICDDADSSQNEKNASGRLMTRTTIAGISSPKTSKGGPEEALDEVPIERKERPDPPPTTRQGKRSYDGMAGSLAEIALGVHQTRFAFPLKRPSSL